MCSNANARFATMKEHKATSALGLEKSKQVFFQVSTISDNFLQSYTCAANRSTALSTTVLQLTTFPRPKALLSAADSTEKSLNTKTNQFRATLSCVPAVSEASPTIFGLRNHLSRNGGAWFLSSLFVRGFPVACAAGRIRRRVRSLAVGPSQEQAVDRWRSAIGVPLVVCVGHRTRHTGTHTDSSPGKESSQDAGWPLTSSGGASRTDQKVYPKVMVSM